MSAAKNTTFLVLQILNIFKFCIVFPLNWNLFPIIFLVILPFILLCFDIFQSRSGFYYFAKTSFTSMVLVLFFNNFRLIIFRIPFFPVSFAPKFVFFPHAIARNCPSSLLMIISNVRTMPFIYTVIVRKSTLPSTVVQFVMFLPSPNGWNVATTNMSNLFIKILSFSLFIHFSYPLQYFFVFFSLLPLSWNILSKK